MGNGESREAKRQARASSFSPADYEKALGYRQGQRASLPAPGSQYSPRGGTGAGSSSPGSSPADNKRRPLAARPSFKGFSFQDTYSDLPSLQSDLRRAGLESCNLIVAIDLTKSNEWSGRYSFGGKNLHSIDSSGVELNPYEASLQIIASTLSAFDDDGYIPLYGFGSAGTNDKAVMSFLPRDQPCHGLEQCLQAYRQVVPSLKLAGPTSFGPVIRKACHVVKQSGGNYHILLIIADGQVTRSSDLPENELSPQERDTIEAVVEASYLPLSIIVVGVGDGEDGWKAMKELDDKLPTRNFDNLQFLSLSEALTLGHRAAPGGARATPQAIKQAMEATFALQALMEIPLQYKAINTLGLMDARVVSNVHVPAVTTIDPPVIPLLHGSMTSPGSAYGGNASVMSAAPQQYSPAGTMPSPVMGAISGGSGTPAGFAGHSASSGQLFPQYQLGASGSTDSYPQKPQVQQQQQQSSGAVGPMTSHRGDFGLSNLALTTPPSFSSSSSAAAGTARQTSSSSSASSSSTSSSSPTSGSVGSFIYSQALHSTGSFRVPPAGAPAVTGAGAAAAPFVVPALSPGSMMTGMGAPVSPASGSARTLRSPNAPPLSTSSTSSGGSSAYSPATGLVGAGAAVVGGSSSSSPTPRPPANPRPARASLSSNGSGSGGGSTVSLDPTSPAVGSRSSSQVSSVAVSMGFAGQQGSSSSSQQGGGRGSSTASSRSPSASNTGTSAAAAAVVDDEAERLRRELETIKQQQCCSVCMEPIEDSGGVRKRVAFQCGHATTCQMCSDRLDHCPQCRTKITARIKLHM